MFVEDLFQASLEIMASRSSTEMSFLCISLQRKINALTEKPRVFLNNQEMMAAMMEGMPLRPLLSFVPGIKREMLEQMVGALNEGVAYNKKNVSMEMKALCQTRN